MRLFTIILGLAAAFTLLSCTPTTTEPSPDQAAAVAPIPAPQPQSGPDLKLTVATAKAPVIDGQLDDAMWKEAALFTDFKPRSGEPAKGKARMLVAQDNKALYIAVECYEDEDVLKELVADCTRHDGAVWQDDSVELFLGPQGAGNYYQIMVNSKGIVSDAFYATPGQSDATWDPQFPSAVKVGNESWVVEMALPWGIFDRSKAIDTIWAFQCQHQRVAGGSERLMFVAFQGSSHQSDKFGRLLGVAGTKAE
jgi:hypothetical protein